MPSIKRAINYLLHNRTQFIDSSIKNLGFLIPDKLYLSLRYRCLMGSWINWNNPKTFTEKLQWLKLYNRKPEYTTMVDKYAVKEYVANIIGEEYIIPTLGIWDKPEDIECDSLPNQFVLKTTHGGGGGGVVICKDKDTFDKTTAIAKLKESMASDIYSGLREWPYKDVPKRIIAEKFMAPEKSPDSVLKSSELLDFKFFCFNGKVRFFKVDFGRFVEHHANYYSPEGELLEFGEQGLEPDPNYPIELPDNLKEMISLAEKLSANEPFLRVDLFNVNGRIFFGELTFYPASGMIPWTTEEADKEIGKYLKL